jgi:hypothetical protein
MKASSQIENNRNMMKLGMNDLWLLSRAEWSSQGDIYPRAAFHSPLVP